MALFINDETAVIWRGPMVTKLETEFLFNVEWGELDCLVLDLPPGTGDAQLTITQRVALAGGVIVTTPQEIALLDVKRGVAMFEEVHVPVLGVVENRAITCAASATIATRSLRMAAASGWRIRSTCRFSASCRWCGSCARRRSGESNRRYESRASGERCIPVDCGEGYRATRSS